MQDYSRPGSGYPHYQYPELPPQNPRPTFLRPLLVALSVFFIIFGAIVLILWLVFRPKLPDFSIQSLSLSNFNAINQRVNATWNAQFQVSNPNKKLSIYYEKIGSSVFHKDYFLSETRIGPFVQRTRNKASLGASYSVVNSFVDWKVVNEMNWERIGGEMKFNLKVVADVSFRYGVWTGRKRFLTVWCNGVSVYAWSGLMTGGPKKCSVS